MFSRVDKNYIFRFPLLRVQESLTCDGNTFGYEIRSVDRDMSFRIDIGLAGNLIY